MSFLGSLVGAGAQLASQQLAYENSKKLTAYTAKTNYKYAKKSAVNSPMWNRAGLENAGYNPMLAVQNATSGANSSWTSNASAPMADIAGGMNNATQALQAKQRLDNETQSIENQTEQTKSQIATNEATAENQRAEASNKRAQNPYISKQAEADIRRTDALTTNLNSDTEKNKATIQNMKSRLELDRILGFGGLNVTRRGQDLDYASSIYGSDAMKYSARKSAFTSVYNANTLKEIADTHSPTGRSASFRNYAGGTADIISSLLHGTNNYYEGEEHTYDYDRNGNISHERHKGTKGKKGKRK